MRRVKSFDNWFKLCFLKPLRVSQKINIDNLLLRLNIAIVCLIHHTVDLGRTSSKVYWLFKGYFNFVKEKSIA